MQCCSLAETLKVMFFLLQALKVSFKTKLKPSKTNPLIDLIKLYRFKYPETKRCMMGASGHVLHVVGVMTLTDVRDAQVLRGFIKLNNKQTERGDSAETELRSVALTNQEMLNLVAVLWTLDGDLLDLLADAQLAVRKVRPVAETNRKKFFQIISS
ncbi:hypothetical protein ATANTOWER_000517 [Ataeniobius toweri]|uniref:Uncharacterized protein n=1 Tax=Ataeniobius toweri TaxID=208326 RepID=A0ABU7AM55_9TELE|nr:hypothetical protein [Ataeniobius toweri]